MNLNRTQVDVIYDVSALLHLPPTTVRAILDASLDSIRLSLEQGDAVTLRGFGRFEPKTAVATKKILPTRGVIEVPERVTISFRASPVLKNKVRVAGCEDIPST